MPPRFALSLVLVVGCASEGSETSTPPVPPKPAPQARAEPPHTELVAAVAREYKSWRLVDDEFHWAPGLCRAPVRGGEHMSRADGAAHDGKLFVLWALDIDAYGVAVGWTDRATRSPDGAPKRGGLPSDVVQVLVKESFVAEQPKAANATRYERIHPAMRDGKTFRPGEPIGLFVMVQLAKAREGTDDGWVYGTVAPDGTVTSATDVGACRDCHSARENRLFGLPRPPALGM